MPKMSRGTIHHTQRGTYFPSIRLADIQPFDSADGNPFQYQGIPH